MTRAKQKRELEIELKLLIRKYYEMGNDALSLDGEDPGDFGVINDEDIAKVLGLATQMMNSSAPADYLYCHGPLPKPSRAKKSTCGMTCEECSKPIDGEFPTNYYVTMTGQDGWAIHALCYPAWARQVAKEDDGFVPFVKALPKKAGA